MSELRKRARELRERMTSSERRLDKILDFLRKRGFSVYRQYPLLKKYIVDFYIPKLKLIIEVDGMDHLITQKRIADRKRDEELFSKGYLVVRVRNEDVLKKPKEVLKRILFFIRNLQLNQSREVNSSVRLPDDVLINVEPEMERGSVPDGTDGGNP